jgi:hypothetical protein
MARKVSRVDVNEDYYVDLSDLSSLCQRHSLHPERCRRVTRRPKVAELTDIVVMFPGGSAKLGIDFGQTFPAFDVAQEAAKVDPRLASGPGLRVAALNGESIDGVTLKDAHATFQQLKSTGSAFLMTVKFPQSPEDAVEAMLRRPEDVSIRWLRASGGGVLMEGELDSHEPRIGNFKSGAFGSWNTRYFVLWPRVPHSSHATQHGHVLAVFSGSDVDAKLLKIFSLNTLGFDLVQPSNTRGREFCLRINPGVDLIHPAEVNTIPPKLIISSEKRE